MKKNKQAARFPIEYRVPFPIPEATNKHTLVAPVGKKRYLLDGFEKSIMVGRVTDEGAADTTFNLRGFNSHVVSDFKDVYTTSAGLIPQPEGGVIAGLYNASELGLARFKANGDVDVSFGQAGTVFHKVEKSSASTGRADSGKSGPQGAASPALQAALTPAEDGKFYAVLGSRFSGNFSLLRCLADGMLDAGFNGTGIISVQHPTFETDAPAVVTSEDGGAVVAGTLGDRLVGMRGFLCRYRADGALDKTFGEQGYSIFDSVSAGIPQPELLQMELGHVAATADGGYVACGYLTARDPWRYYGLLVRVDSSGRPEQAFNNGKPLLFELSGVEIDFLWGGVVEMADGRIVVAGGAVTRDTGYQRHVLLARYDAKGVLDSTFGEQGWMVLAPFGDAITYLQSLQVDSEQKVLVSGDSGPDNNLSSMKGFAAQLD
ncbi:hypothetical protein [Pseudomonas oryzicola]|uniref:Delta-60 repeat domain-containing protein n=1 Tax=Pseudomonas oryzicola TaxID=485876 RepID=A0ABS6Q8H5_9PSED|nr:hypothetical protein [Pseudomonas oryzicola]MBV4490254.1 hypothetical protein [Pseudomonas oryzicola]